MMKQDKENSQIIIKLMYKQGKMPQFFITDEGPDKLIRFFNALYKSTKSNYVIKKLINKMNFVKGRCPEAEEIWTYEVGDDHVVRYMNNYNVVSNTYAYGKVIGNIQLFTQTS